MDIKLDYSDISFQNNGKLKLLIIVGTRPEIIRLAEVITKCRRYFDTILAHTGQNYDYNLNARLLQDDVTLTDLAAFGLLRWHGECLALCRYFEDLFHGF